MPPRFADAASMRDPASIALAGVLAMALAFQLLMPAPPPGGAMATSPIRGARTAPPLSMVAGHQGAAVELAQILDHPIFNPSRTEGAAPAQASDVYLLGFARDDSGALATLGDRAGATTTLRPGESWQGWTLVGVGRGAAVLRRGDATLTLQPGQPLAAAPPTTSGGAARAPANAP